MTPETPAKVTATTLPDEPKHAEGCDGGRMCDCGYRFDYDDYVDALLQSFNAERLRAEAAEASYKEIVDYVCGYFPVGMCYVNPIQAMNVVVDRMTRAEARAEAMAKALQNAKSTLEIGRQFIDVSQEERDNWKGHAQLVEQEIAAIDTAIEQGAQHG